MIDMTQDSVRPSRWRDSLAALAIGAVWSFFTVLLVMMATSKEFTRGARFGMAVAAVTCGLFAFLSFGRWLVLLIEVLTSDEHSDLAKSPGADVDGSTEDEESRLFDSDAPLEIRDDDADDDAVDQPLTFRDEVEEDGLVFTVFMAILCSIPTLVFLALGLPGFVAHAIRCGAWRRNLGGACRTSG